MSLSSSILSLFITSVLTSSNYANGASTGKDVIFEKFPMLHNKMMEMQASALRPFTRRGEEFDFDQECADVEENYYDATFGTVCECSGDESDFKVACENNCEFCLDDNCARGAVSVGMSIDGFDIDMEVKSCYDFDDDSFDGITLCYVMDLESADITIDGKSCNSSCNLVTSSANCSFVERNSSISRAYLSFS